jgi:hypothetical protein
MEILSMPLRVVIALWLTQRIKQPKGTTVLIDPASALLAQYTAISNCVRPETSGTILERILSKVVNDHVTNILDKVVELNGLHVVAIGFIAASVDHDK